MLKMPLFESPLDDIPDGSLDFNRNITNYNIIEYA